MCFVDTFNWQNWRLKDVLCHSLLCFWIVELLFLFFFSFFFRVSFLAPPSTDTIVVKQLIIMILFYFILTLSISIFWLINMCAKKKSSSTELTNFSSIGVTQFARSLNLSFIRSSTGNGWMISKKFVQSYSSFFFFKQIFFRSEFNSV